MKLNRKATAAGLVLFLVVLLSIGCSSGAENVLGENTNPAADPEAPGEVLVELTWETDADLDLEIWTNSEGGYRYLADASELMNAPDITTGSEGKEWFEFRETQQVDFSAGQWVISPFFYAVGPSGSEEAEVTLTLTIGGKVETFTKTLGFSSDQNQWLAVSVDMDRGQWEMIDEFFEPVTSGTIDGDVRVELSWDGDADLDLEIWTETSTSFEYEADASVLMNFPDINDGNQGLEWFEFRETRDHDFSQGTWIISPCFWEVGQSGQSTAVATLKLIIGDETHVFTQGMSTEEPYDQWVALRVNMSLGVWEVINYFDQVIPDVEEDYQSEEKPGTGF